MLPFSTQYPPGTKTYGLQAEEYRGTERNRGWNHRICSRFSIAHIPSVSAHVFRDGISRCPRQRNTATPFDALAEHILRIKRNSGSRCLAWGKGQVLILLGRFFLFVRSRRKIFSGKRMQVFTAPDKMNPFKIRVLHYTVHFPESLKNLRDRIFNILPLSHHSYRCGGWLHLKCNSKKFRKNVCNQVQIFIPKWVGVILQNWQNNSPVLIISQH